MTKLLTILFILLSLHSLAQDLANLAHQKPIAISGSIGLRLNAYRSNVANPFYPSYGYTLTGSPTISVYGIAVPLNFLYTSQELSVLGQPFNQFGISPTYRQFTLHLGYRNFNYSKYAMGGYQLFGVGGEYEKGNWRAAFCYGRLKKMAIVAIDSSSLLPPYTYTRKAISGMVRYGKNNRFVALNFIKAQDNANSISDETKKQYGQAYFSTPASNLVMDVQSKLPIFTKRLTLESEAAISYYTDDITSPFGLNTAKQTTLPFSKIVKNVLVLNATSHVYTAIDGKLNYLSNNGSNVYVQYKRIDPNYQSMGVYYLQGDMQNILVGAGSSFFKRKVRIEGSLGKQNDNLGKTRLSQSIRWIGSLNTSYTGQKFGIDASYMNYSSNQMPAVSRYADSLRVTQTTHTVNICPHYVLSNTAEVYQLFNLMLSINTSLDLNPSLTDITGKERKLTTHNATASYSLNLIKQGLGSTTSLVVTSLTDHVGYAYKSVGFNTGVNKGVFKKKISLALNGGVFKTIQEVGSSINHTLTFSAGYAITKKLQTDFLAMYNDSPSVSSIINLPSSTREFRTELNLHYTF